MYDASNYYKISDYAVILDERGVFVSEQGWFFI